VKTCDDHGFLENRRSYFAQKRRSRLRETSEDPLLLHINEFSHRLRLHLTVACGARR
jgi:hypothetical protein